MTNNPVFTRRSVRNFLSKAVETEKMERILRAGMEAPSAHNRRPWEFIVITDPAKQAAIAEMSPYAKMLPSAAAAIVVCVDLKRGAKTDPEDTYWVQDCSAATENILVQIADEGLGGVWLGWYPDTKRVEAFRAYFDLPAHIIPFSIIAVGYPEKSAETSNRYDEKLVHWNSWK
jgi:nitroreductase